MIISKCPLRVSLAGGSTDLQLYLDHYNVGRVITFSANLYTYIILKPSDRYYRIIYSSIDNCVDVDDIKNDIAREVIRYFNLPPVEVIFTSDVPSTGSGLASSSSYLIAMINAALQFLNIEKTTDEIGFIAVKIERSFNPLTGYQDVYGCLIPGFKQLVFDKSGLMDVLQYSTSLFNAHDVHLIPTSLTRSSTNVLMSLDIHKIHQLIDSVYTMDKAINGNDDHTVLAQINEGWYLKKQTSPTIINAKIKLIDERLQANKAVLAHRLLGAGAGGYFLVLSTKGHKLGIRNYLQIQLGSGPSVTSF